METVIKVEGEKSGSGTLDVTSTDATGALTINFISDFSTTYSGFALNANETTCETGSCPAPQVEIAVSEADYEATLTFTDPNDSESPVFGYKYGVSGFDPESATGNTTTTTTATITGLAPLTSYDLYVYSVCESTPGNMVRYSFTTPFIPTWQARGSCHADAG